MSNVISSETSVTSLPWKYLLDTAVLQKNEFKMWETSAIHRLSHNPHHMNYINYQCYKITIIQLSTLVGRCISSHAAGHSNSCSQPVRKPRQAASDAGMPCMLEWMQDSLSIKHTKRIVGSGMRQRVVSASVHYAYICYIAVFPRAYTWYPRVYVTCTHILCYAS